VIFEDQFYHIFYVDGQKILQAKIRGKSFSFLPFDEEHTTFSTKLNDTENGISGSDTVINNKCLV
jgi:hypothetical protein